MAKGYTWYVLTGALFILGLALGFFTGKMLFPASQNAQQVMTNTPPSSSDLYSTQLANIYGEVIASDDNYLTVRNTATKAEGKVKVSDRIAVSKQTKAGQIASPSTGLSTLELNKPALIQLEMRNGEYEAIVISYFIATVTTLPNPALKP